MVAVVTANIKAQLILADLDKKVKDGVSNGDFDDNPTLNVLQSAIGSAADGVNTIVQAGLKIFVLITAAGTSCNVVVLRH